MTRTSRRRLLAGTLGSSLLAQVEPAPEVRLPRKIRLALAGFDGHPEEILRVLPQLPDVELVAVAGEGAANQGAFHESLNLASLWKLPVVFVIEDNDWAISVARTASTSVPSNATRAAAYGVAGERVEGNDVEAVYQAAGRAVARARAGEGPTLLEVHTVRLWGHFEGDAQAYRGDELAVAESHDPIPAYEAKLRADGVLDDATVEAVRAEAATEVADAIAFAKSSPEPPPAAAYEHVFV